jgi:hypothetical protein
MASDSCRFFLSLASPPSPLLPLRAAAEAGCGGLVGDAVEVE